MVDLFILMCARFFRVFHLTDWCPSSRNDNHRSGAHVAAELLVRDGRSLEFFPGYADPVSLVSQLQLLVQSESNVWVRGRTTAPPRVREEQQLSVPKTQTFGAICSQTSVNNCFIAH